MPEFQSWNRIYSYIQDYYQHLYRVYADKYTPAYPVTYYSLDKDNSIWDTEKLMAGSYSRRGVGDLSGVKFKKILLLPVFFMEPIHNRAPEGSEMGYTDHQSLKTSLIIPSVYGIVPSPDDRIDIGYAFQTTDSAILKGLYAVNNVNNAVIGEDFNLYQLQIGVDYNIGKIENQISSYWTFYDHSKKIIPLTNASTLLKIQNRYSEITKKVNRNLYDEQTGLFLNKVTL
jgi:hypothetical protein